MKRFILTLALVVIGVAARAASVPLTYVHSVRITPGTAPLYVLAFQNTSTTIDVLVHKIEVSAASTQTVTGGLMQFWVYASTSLTHSTAAGQAASYGTANVTAPSYVSVSTAPLLVLLEGETSTTTATTAINFPTTALPVVPPLRVNNDEGATANFYDSWSAENQSGVNPAGPLLLAHNSQRALVFEKRGLTGTDYTAGLVQIRVHYTVR